MHHTEPPNPRALTLPRLSPEQVAAMQAPEVTDALTRALGAAFQHLTISRQQARPHVFGMTLDEFAGCARQAAYRISATPPTDPSRVLSGQDRLTNLHHATTAAVLPALGHVLGAHHQVAVTLKAAGLSVPGVVPLYWHTAAVLAYVVSTPSPADRQHSTALMGGSPQWFQVQQPRARLTAAALALAALQARLPVAWLVEINISRGTGDSHVAIEPMTEEHERTVQRRATELAAYATDPDNAPCEERRAVTHVAPPCARCPWLGRCWPDHPPLTKTA